MTHYMNWNKITSTKDIDSIIDSSERKKVIIFKHSPSCYISKMALRQFENELKVDDAQTELYFIDVINERPISQAIASKLQVHHESPQLLVLENKKVSFHRSHSSISASELSV